MFSQGCRKLLWIPYGGCTKQRQHVLLVLPSRGESRDCPRRHLAPGRSWRFFYVRRPQAPWTCYHHREFYPSLKQMFLHYFFLLTQVDENNQLSGVEKNPYSWGRKHNMLYIDNPVGAGQHLFTLHILPPLLLQVSPSAIRCPRHRWK